MISRPRRALLVAGLVVVLLALGTLPASAVRPVRVSYFGDSVAFTYVFGVTEAGTAAFESGALVMVPGSARMGCPVARYARGHPGGFNPEGDTDPACDWSRDVTWEGDPVPGFTHVVQTNPTDIAVLMYCGWDTAQKRIPTGPGTWDTEFRTIGDPAFDAYLQRELVGMADALFAGGARVVAFATCGSLRSPKTGEPIPANEGIGKWMDLLRHQPEIDPRVAVIDFGAWLDQQEIPLANRPDGVHFSAVGARLAADDYLDQQILALARAAG